MAAEGESLESLLNRATNPLNRDEDWDIILGFCDQINKELEGPQISVRLLAHKIQSPQEREALLGLAVLESCVKNCGKRFHQEIGKFRFLNEIIKVVSPKYLGNHTTEKVKKKCIELLYSWSKGLAQEGKVHEAYQMLKRQGIVTQDPTHVDQFSKTLQAPASPRVNAVFEDDEKAKLLSRLLKSKHPEDLQAANRLIKNMVKQDAERMEKVSRRVQQIETVNNNIKVLNEMLTHYRPGSASDAEKDLMKELFENLEKARPNLFRLASDTDEKDNEGIDAILKTNDEVLAMMNKYKKIVDGGDTSHNSQSSSSGLIDMNSDRCQEPSVMSQLKQNDLDMLNDIFTSSPKPESSTSVDIGMLSLGAAPTSVPVAAALPPPLAPPPTLTAPATIRPLQNTAASNPTKEIPSVNWNQPVVGSGAVGGGMSTNLFTGSSLSKPSTLPTGVQATKTNPQPSDKAERPGFEVLDQLGKNLMQQSLSTVTAPSIIPVPSTNAQSLTLNQMATKPTTATGTTASTVNPTPLPSLFDQPAPIPASLAGQNLPGGPSPIPTPPHSATASPLKTATKTVEIQPLTELSIPLETVQPGTHPPVTVYDKDNIKAVVHIGKDRPRPDVLVMVLSMMSTHSSPVKGLIFQAAVPKIMKVKLQPPSATDLPGYNPILPPTAITQVMLIANPSKEKIRLKFKVAYTVDSKSVSDVGDVDTFQIQ